MLRHEGDPSRCAVILPGARYSSQAPLLWFAREAARELGWSALEVDERAPVDREPFAWMRDQAERALAAAGADLVVPVGKSLGSVAAPLASGPAVWLTPLLARPGVADALRATEAPTLLVGSPADPSWSEGALPDNPALEVLELEGLDHSLQLPGDTDRSLEVLRTVTARIRAFLARVSA